MTKFKTFSQIVRSMRDNLKLSQPNLDTKPGSVSRDLFIDIPADEIESLYRAMSAISEKQNPQTAVGSDLDKWARNFGITRRSPSPANGLVIFSTNTINSDLPIPSGTLVSAKNGVNYRTIGNYIFSVSDKSRYAATATKLRSSLQIAGITDQYAIEVPVSCISAGKAGNIASLQVNRNDLSDPLRVTNLVSFSGGSNQESDASFRARIFSVFSGANTGTASGYINAALSVSGVLDAIVVQPGNTLMLRDGTEIIELDDGKTRVLSSGSGGKVDIYIIGTQLEEVTETYIYTDKSGRADATDTRNDHVLGVQLIDTTLTSEERRVNAFATGNFPLQPVNALISISGTSSGILFEKSIDVNSVQSGNFELIKDTNVDTGGSPFGFDKIHFISSKKDVTGESINKKEFNSVDALKFTEINEISDIYQDISVQRENSSVSSANRNIVILNHKPITGVSKIVNKTTGETYVIQNQNLNSSGLNVDGRVIISGKTLPVQSDILSCDYTWRLYFENSIDYNGALNDKKDLRISDSADWGSPNIITLEESILKTTNDDQEFQVEVDYKISRVLGIYTFTEAESTIIDLDDSGKFGISLNIQESAVSNIISVINSNKLELYKTSANDGSFAGRKIILPSDSPYIANETVTIKYNKVEFYNITDGNGISSNNIITLPSRDILKSNELEDLADNIVLSNAPIFVDYVATTNIIIPSISMSTLPVYSGTSNSLFDSNLLTIVDSAQPVFYRYNDSSIDDLLKYSPSRLSTTVSGISKSGRVRFSGETLTKLTFECPWASFVGLKLDVQQYIKDFLNIQTIPSNIGIARVLSVYASDDGTYLDSHGSSLNSVQYSFGSQRLDESLSKTQFILPSTPVNTSIPLTSGSKVVVTLFIYNSNDTEDLYFQADGQHITSKMFIRVNSISAFSGFRNNIGNIIGTIIIKNYTQPIQNSLYYIDYNFKSPKEGERLTIKYNLNKLILNASTAVEDLRSITADVLIKESPSLPIDVFGELLISDDALTQSETIKEDVSNKIVNLLNTSVLGSTIDYSDIISSAASVPGVDSINVSLFNESGNVGRRTYIKALDNQNIIAGTVIFTVKPRSEFQIT